MKLFNSIQAVVLYALWPFFMSYLHGATFSGAFAAFWVSVAAYVAGTLALIGAVRAAID